MDLDAELQFAAALADIADAVTLPAFERRRFTVTWKPDETEVTEVDRACELALVGRIRAERPDHGVVGEELGAAPASPVPGTPAVTWLIDPIDGTSGFVRGFPVWATLLALTVGDDVVVAMVSAPALGRRWWATRGGGAWADGRRCRVSDVPALAAAQVSVTLNGGWDELGLTPALNAIALEARRCRGVGDFWQHMLVAEGAMDVAVDAVGVRSHDVAGARLIVDEAGGRCTDRHGCPVHTSGTAISTNGRLHDEIIGRLATAAP